MPTKSNSLPILLNVKIQLSKFRVCHFATRPSANFSEKQQSVIMTQSLPLDFPEMWEVFGGSVFHEDLRGDLVQVGRQIDEFRQARTSQNSESQAGAFLLSAVHSILSGEIVAAVNILNGII